MYDMNQVIVNFKLLSGQIKKELDIQFDDSRIKGTEYADVFNKLMSQAMQHSFESPLKEAQEAEVNSRTELIDKQIADQKYVTDHIRPQEKQKIECEVNLCKEQVKKVKSDIELTDKQILIATEQINTESNRTIQVLNQANLLKAQEDDQVYVTTYIRPSEKLIKEKEVEIATQKVLIEETNTQIRLQELEIKKEELNIARKKVELATKDVAYKEAQTNFTIRQTEGFDDNKKQKMLDAQLNAWAMMFSSGLLDQVPSVINQCMVDGLYNMMAGEVGAPTSGNCQSPTRRSDGSKKCNK